MQGVLKLSRLPRHGNLARSGRQSTGARPHHHTGLPLRTIGARPLIRRARFPGRSSFAPHTVAEITRPGYISSIWLTTRPCRPGEPTRARAAPLIEVPVAPQPSELCVDACVPSTQTAWFGLVHSKFSALVASFQEAL